jgi:hypothetical protein
MRNAQNIFQKNICDVRAMLSVYDFLHITVSSLNCDDILRLAIVNSVSAFDRLLHDIIRIGMVDIFNKKRPQTRKYLAEKISLNKIHDMSISQISRDYIFNQEIIAQHKKNSYQNSKNVSDGLSYIWDEQNKWDNIAVKLSSHGNTVKMQLDLIVSRRNNIVHEGDSDFLNSQKYPIMKSDCVDSVDFIERCGNAIVDLVV